jgi:hypothetical protein
MLTKYRVVEIGYIMEDGGVERASLGKFPTREVKPATNNRPDEEKGYAHRLPGHRGRILNGIH